MILSDFACILSETTRSQAYVQALAKNDLQPAECLLLVDNQAKAVSDKVGNDKNFIYFDLNESVQETLKLHNIAYKIIDSRDINSDEAAQAIQTLSQTYILYSGYGGYILRPHLFQMGKKWIHVHAGILPVYRGSTTAYYSLLREGTIGATAIFLNEKIDEGDIITAQSFKPAIKGELIDYVYEPYIRSCVLVKALKEYLENGEFSVRRQDAQNAETYFIIHPVLKHIAILGLDKIQG